MVKLVPAHIENDRVVPDAPLPPTQEVRSVAILVELAEAQSKTKESTLSKMIGIIKDPGDWKADYIEHLEKKHR